jgi:hypothetical protein
VRVRLVFIGVPGEVMRCMVRTDRWRRLNGG